MVWELAMSLLASRPVFMVHLLTPSSRLRTMTVSWSFPQCTQFIQSVQWMLNKCILLESGYHQVWGGRDLTKRQNGNSVRCEVKLHLYFLACGTLLSLRFLICVVETASTPQCFCED
jgi:hypothetical protein